jgi:hypothetical protein
MKKKFRVEKINIVDDNLEFSLIKIRVTLFKKVVFSYSYKPKTSIKEPLKYI